MSGLRIRKSPRIVGLFGPYIRTLLTLVWSEDSQKVLYIYIYRKCFTLLNLYVKKMFSRALSLENLFVFEHVY